eukprot:CAMPEP_0170089274 /NCGR_PEP_ID=MMETSP0019_2-20121128/23368_1 /TAXON_ID=98059 /ORGANISM="Dinobryon sp., Strain UTEXLB2267" /LENGTH=74 /DNA_ID=CAMNT_0010307993 /DNA_START=271 /DNA_END=495 /DNA_ORIENTATION=+
MANTSPAVMASTHSRVCSWKECVSKQGHSPKKKVKTSEEAFTAVHRLSGRYRMDWLLSTMSIAVNTPMGTTTVK